MTNSNSNQPPTPSVGATLTGGIQDVSAILPIIGTDQCERHMGSALSGGYLYAASGPLSIFGSLGIIKIGVGVLISSIAIPKFWVSPSDLRPSGPKGKSKQSIFLGAKMLQNTGFQLAGNVAPLIGMDGTRFKAETKLIQILEEKHIEKPENVSIRWKSKQWNIMLVLSTIVAAAMSGIPYFALLLGPTSWRPTIHLPWLFPFLRTVGSCFASICCQFIIQSRVISSMKSRIIFMTMYRDIAGRLSKDNEANLDDWLKYHLQWDSELPSEQCIWNLERFFSSYDNISTIARDVQPNQPTERHISIDMPPDNPPPTRWIYWRHRTSSRPQLHPPPPKPLFQNDYVFSRYRFGTCIDKHFPSRKSDRAIAFISWMVLCLSLPATVAGYVGCFTLVSATPSPGNGPLVWLGLEAALSVIRILIWAWNPTFDEDTDVTVELELDSGRPFDWTEELTGFIHDLEKKQSKPLVLLPERQFLERITAYTGPLGQYQRPDNIALYFTLMADDSLRTGEVGNQYISLLITVIDFNTRIGVTLLHLGGSFYYFDAIVNHDDGEFNEINARLQSTMRNIYHWKRQVGILFTSLERHYTYLVQALNENRTQNPAEYKAILDLKWDLSLRPTLTTSPLPPPQSPGHDHLYPDQSPYEHHLKTNLIELWSRWIVRGIGYIAGDARNDCYEALEDKTSEKAKWELIELDRLVAWEWIKREQSLIACSFELEDILRVKMEKSINQVRRGQEDGRLEVWMRTGFEISRRKRLENERGEAKKRMSEAMHNARALAERKTRSWRDQEWFAPKWQEGIKFIDTLWSDGISKGPTAPENAESEVDKLAQIDISFDGEDATRFGFVDQVKQRFAHWNSQRENERREMDATIERIRSAGDQKEQLDSAYEYPEVDNEATFKFVDLHDSTSKGKACSAIVYDAEYCSAEAVCDVTRKSTTRSVVNVGPNIVASIPPNDHLLFLSCRGEGEEPAFVQSNRDRWWDQQTTNSSLLYFTPEGVAFSSSDSCYVSSGPIAQIFVFLATASRVRLRLLHSANNQFHLSIQQNGKIISTLSDGIPIRRFRGNFKLQALQLEQLGPGRHELQLVVARRPEQETTDWYHLRDILIEFLDDPDQITSVPGDPDHTNEVLPTIGAADSHSGASEQELSNGPQSPLPLLDNQDSGLEDRTHTQILNEDRELEPNIDIQYKCLHLTLM